ncbi:Oligoxyloglucan reducing end-specific cellobiohydrolase [Acaromyces ingoldii]|uniref:Vacuolar protein sorting/targeting protein 10 n=1 Tax=Acaromyces ingoldii TaxID=215250 RepID=A0A316YLV7_9BASI|nr:Oligoxyloglucan reducing end-specific cellobiohydrolase [Acaromyces ingoldii]PWN88715.1 Oligoxyloglucan reducing end-specific cellobiohydrolase [Acaromyces ingoldii]
MERRSRGRRNDALRGRVLALAAAVLLVLVSLAAVAPARAAASAPSVARNRFANLPASLVYIDDTSIVMYHDALNGEVHRSDDEGKTWKPVKGPAKGEAYLLVQHPYDKRMSFILSSGTKHWRSTDMGNTWHKFETPSAPAVRAGAPLEFNADQKHADYIIFTGKHCTMWTPWGGHVCHDEAFYTTDAFASTPKPLIVYLMHCTWAKSSKAVAVKPEHAERIYCIAWDDSPTGSHPAERKAAKKRAPTDSPTKLFYTDDFFKTGKRAVDLDLGRDATQFVGFGPSNQFLVTALKDTSSSAGGGGGAGTGIQMALYVSHDGDQWQRAQFPHGAGLAENAYTIVEGTAHSLVVDVQDALEAGDVGTLYTSDSTGVRFVKSLEGTSRSRDGIVDYEHLANIEGVSLVNVKVAKDASQPGSSARVTKSMITYDDGSSWNLLPPPKDQVHRCGATDAYRCSLHLWSVTHMHNTGRVFSSTAPGFVMGVGSVGDQLLPYEDCDTFLSTDAGRTWTKIQPEGAHKYEFGDQGNLLVVVGDEDATDHASYSWDHGKTWQTVKLGVTLRPKVLTTILDGTSQKFLLIGSQTRKQAGKELPQVAVFLDFAGMKRKCTEKDMEEWYFRDEGKGEPKCLMGHKQHFKRRKPNADCYVGDKFHDPEPRHDPCPCTDEDYECDFGFVRDEKGQCQSTGREELPPGACAGPADKTFQGSSGYRKIPGNECDRDKGVKKDEPVTRNCDGVAAPPGQPMHRRTHFDGEIVDHAYFPDSSNVLLALGDGSIWRSLNDGLGWSQMEVIYDQSYPDAHYLTMAMHTYDKERGYLITNGQRIQYTYNGGKAWHFFSAPTPANNMGLPILSFHPIKSDWLIWTGSYGDCSSTQSTDCRAVAFYSLDHGTNWLKIDEYVRTCAWARTAKFHVDPTAIVCESYADKKGNQRSFDAANNNLELVWGPNHYDRRGSQRRRLFNAVEGFAVFDEFFIVADYGATSDTLSLKVSMDGHTFAPAHFPPNTRLEKRAYTILDSVTNSVFLHGTTHSKAGSEWGSLFRSNWNGTYYTLSLDHVNRNEYGYVDFEKMLGLDGVAMANVVSNPDEASVSGVKTLQTRITHNDGGRWRPLTPPERDVRGQPYACNDVGCQLHLHGYTERDDPRSTYSSPSAVGFMLAVGNVGKTLAPYRDSDTFLTRDGGFTWEEVHKDAHKWEYGDQGSLLVLVNDEQATDTVLYSTDEGLSWREYRFGEQGEKVRVTNIVTVPEDTHRKFILLGTTTRSANQAVAIHLDFSSLSSNKCHLDTKNPDKGDFELWSPSEGANDRCLFGREVSYWRRKRTADCYVGRKLYEHREVVRNCTCTMQDFECNFNFFPDPADPDNKCLPYPGSRALGPTATMAEQCDGPAGDYYYEPTSMRRVPHSSCDGGLRPDRGARHVCPTSLRRHGFLWWTSLLLAPFLLAALVGAWWTRRSGSTSPHHRRPGAIRLPQGSGIGGTDDYFGGDSKLVQTLASVPWFIVGTAGLVWARSLDIAERLPLVGGWLRTRPAGSYGGYRGLHTDDDAEILRDYEDDEPDRL